MKGFGGRVPSPLSGEGRRSRGEGSIVISAKPSSTASGSPSPAGKAKTRRGKNPAAWIRHVPVKQVIVSSVKDFQVKD